MDLLRTLLIYMTLIFVSSVQTAPEPTIIPEPVATLEATATPTLEPTPSPTPVPTPAITPNPAYKTIRVGDNGDKVLELQAKLAEYGYYNGDIDGRFGNQTRRAVELFQYANGLYVDGIAGRHTLTVLFESDEVRPAPTATPDPNLETLSTAKPLDTSTPIPIAGGTPASDSADVPSQTVGENDNVSSADNTDNSGNTDNADKTDNTENANSTADAQKSASTDNASPTIMLTDAPTVSPDGDTAPDGDKAADGSAAPDSEAAPEGDTVPEGDIAPDNATSAPSTAADYEPVGTPELAPSAPPAPEFMPMQGYSISIAGSDDVLYAKPEADNSAATSSAAPADEPTADPTAPVPLEPCILGVDVYVPLIRILEAANVLVIPNETMDITEYAFALGDDIYRIAFTENQAGDPTGLEAYLNNEAQTLPVSDIYMSQGEVYLPMESVEGLTGIHFDMDEERELLIATMP